MKQYLDLVSHIQQNGVLKSDRTGTGTKSIFGYQMRFNLQDNFPIVTTKRTHMHAVITELLWFLKGDTNTKYLTDNRVKIWNEWATDKGELGPVYGEQWRSWNIQPEVQVIDIRHQTFNSIEHFPELIPDNTDPLYLIWTSIIQTYQHINSKPELHWYSLDPTWACYETFANDVSKLPNYYKWVKNPSLYKFNPYYYNITPVYSKETCVWSTLSEFDYCANQLWGYHVSTNDAEFDVLTLDQIAVMFPTINTSNISCTTSNRYHIDGITFTKILPPPGKLFRHKLPVDQISELIDQIKNNPDSRRLIVSGWNPAVLPDTSISPKDNAKLNKAALPPCHTLMQFYVIEGKLSCQLYQRSADVFLGVPFNIASYALLTHMIAQVCDLEVGDFIHTFGDAHLYSNHQDQVAELLTRSPMERPILKLNPSIRNIFDFNISDISFETDYCHHPAIIAPIAV